MIHLLSGNLALIISDVNWEPFLVSVIAIFVGIASIFAGIKIKQFYATIGMSGYLTKKEIEPTGARFLFIVLGVVFLSVGTYLLVKLFLH